ncbi:MAG: YARHG domain-containing protein, partial [Lachnospiraceae bacterium]|nr:YARHG domain-containing protein [Lachnospiraceae bacterium]
EEFKRYFESKSWYNGTIPAEEFDANQSERFNDVEKANINALVAIAQERGLR